MGRVGYLISLHFAQLTMYVWTWRLHSTQGHPLVFGTIITPALVKIPSPRRAHILHHAVTLKVV